MTNCKLPTANCQSSLLKYWLIACIFLIFCMVAVGGYTRLSGSGLSITEWKPIHGVIPPLNEQEWQEEFDKYRQIPQYEQVNKGMTIAEFKAIFWPEYWHRVLGRAIGIVFFVPFVFFWVRKQIDPPMARRMLLIFALGGLQGFMGWYMVSSGLSENLYVSHFRLAAHFSLALLILGLLVWALADGRGQMASDDKKPVASSHLLTAYRLWFTLLCLQILYGAFMAGLHAGLFYNTWPTMNGQWAADGMWSLTPGWINFFENHATVQFIHRTLAILVVLGFAFWWFVNREYVRNRKLTSLCAGIAAVLALQFLLGVLTLVNVVPLGLALKHQLAAVVLFGLSVVLLHRSRT